MVLISSNKKRVEENAEKVRIKRNEMRSAKQYVGIKSGHLTWHHLKNKIIIQIIIQNF